MSYIPVAQRTKTAPAPAPQPAPVLNVVPAKPAQTISGVINNPVSTPANLQGGPAQPLNPAIKPPLSPLQGSGLQPQVTSPTEDFQTTIADRIFQPTSPIPNTYTPVSLRVTGVNNTPAPVPVYTLSQVNGKSQLGEQYTNNPGQAQIVTDQGDAKNKANWIDFVSQSSTGDLLKKQFGDNILTKAAGFVYDLGLDPVTRDLADISTVDKISKRVASGEIDPSVFDGIEVLHKTAPQIFGDVGQAVLLSDIGPGALEAIVGSTEKKALNESLLQLAKIGGKEGGLGGLQYGVAQALSSGSTNADEIGKIIIGNTAGGVLLGSVLKTAIPALSKIIAETRGIQNKVYDSLIEKGYSPEEARKLSTTGGFLGKFQQKFNPKAEELGQKINELNKRWVEKPTPANKKALDLAKILYRQELQGGFVKNPFVQDDILGKAHEDYTLNYAPKIDDLNKQIKDVKAELALPKMEGYAGERHSGYLQGEINYLERQKSSLESEFVNNWRKESGLPPEFNGQDTGAPNQQNPPITKRLGPGEFDTTITPEESPIAPADRNIQSNFLKNFSYNDIVRISQLSNDQIVKHLNDLSETKKFDFFEKLNEFKDKGERLINSKDIEQIKRSIDFNSSINPETGNVNPPSVRGGVTSPELNLNRFKDKATFSLARETLERNIDAVAATPEDAAKLHEFLTDPIRKNETARIDFTNQLKNDVKATTKELGIKAGSEDDQLVQMFGEKNITLDELKERSPKNWQNIEEASNFFRNKYDDLLNKVNASREKFGYQAIPKRADYFRHFEEITNVINQLGVLFRQQDLPTEIAGITDIFKPGKPFSTAELARKGDMTTFSAIKGMDNYIDAISKQIFHIDSVQRVRALENYIRLAGSEGQAKLPAFVANLNEYGNLLAGKSAKLDRAVESVIGRRVFKAANFIKSQTGLSLVAGNISSALTNFIPFTQSLATTEKLPALKGLLDGFVAPFTNDLEKIDGVKSDFLTRRYAQGKIAPSLFEKVVDKSGWLFKSIDEFTGRSIVAGKYYEGLSKGLTEAQAMKEADTYAGKVLADRSFGQLPNLFGSKTAGFVTQFQTEVNNMFSFLTKDIPNMSKGNKLKLASSFAQFTLYSYLFNDAYQQVTGRRPTLDPIYAGLTLLGQTDASKRLGLLQKSTTAGKDIASNLPFGNLIPGLGSGGRLPIASWFPSLTKLSQGDLTELLNPVSLQIKKSVQGAEAFSQGKVTDGKGKTEFNIDQNPANFGRSVLFGKYASPQAQEYFNNGSKAPTQIKPGKLPPLPKAGKLPKLPKIK